MKKSKKKEITPVSFRIYTPLYEKIKWYAENQRRSVNRQVELIFEEFFEKNHIEIKKELTTEENQFNSSLTKVDYLYKEDKMEVQKSIDVDQITPKFVQGWLNERPELTQGALARLSLISENALCNFLGKPNKKNRATTLLKIAMGMEKYENEKGTF